MKKENNYKNITLYLKNGEKIKVSYPVSATTSDKDEFYKDLQICIPLQCIEQGKVFWTEDYN